jgi:hypothetical protein
MAVVNTNAGGLINERYDRYTRVADTNGLGHILTRLLKKKPHQE